MPNCIICGKYFDVDGSDHPMCTNCREIYPFKDKTLKEDDLYEIIKDTRNKFRKVTEIEKEYLENYWKDLADKYSAIIHFGCTDRDIILEACVTYGYLIDSYIKSELFSFAYDYLESFRDLTERFPDDTAIREADSRSAMNYYKAINDHKRALKWSVLHLLYLIIEVEHCQKLQFIFQISHEFDQLSKLLLVMGYNSQSVRCKDVSESIKNSKEIPESDNKFWEDYIGLSLDDL